jgi:ESS family glutamate:Na+ symporter
VIATLESDLFQGLGWLALAVACLSLILAVGRAIGTRLQLRLWGIPEALLAGLLGLLLAPGGPLPLGELTSVHPAGYPT